MEAKQKRRRRSPRNSRINLEPNVMFGFFIHETDVQKAATQTPPRFRKIRKTALGAGFEVYWWAN
jgi:hypothetical protein